MALLVAAGAPGLAWYLGVALLAVGLLAHAVPHRAWSALAVALALLGALDGWGWAWAVPCVGAWASRAARLPRRASTDPHVLLETVLHGPDPIAANLGTWLAVTFAGTAILVLPQALGPAAPGDGWVLPTLARATAAAMGGVAAAERLPVRWNRAWMHAAAGLLPLVRLAIALSLPGEARVHAAARLQAVPVVYDALARRADPAILTALVRAVPDRDEAALGLGWSAALAAGWKPRHARGVELPVARALAAGGREDEAMRILAGVPRTGEADWLLALLERAAGRPDGWRGGRGPGFVVPGRVDVDVPLPAAGRGRVEFTALAPLTRLVLHARPPECDLRVTLDAHPPVPWTTARPLELGPVGAGPHRIDVVDSVASGGGGGPAPLRNASPGVSCGAVTQVHGVAASEPP